MDAHAQRQAEAREDERTRFFAAQRAAAIFEEEIRADERRKMVQRGRAHDRNGLRSRADDTGFTPGPRGLI